MTGSALELTGVSASYPGGGEARGTRRAALRQVDIRVAPGEFVAVVGESGCGKTTLAKVACGLMAADQGRLQIGGSELDLRRLRRPRALRKRMQLVFQDPYSTLNPVLTIARSVAEGLAIHRIGSPRDRRRRSQDALREVGLDEDFWSRRPHELSGGQRQRVAIARALITEPEVVILDEPTSALDLSVQAQILNLLLHLQRYRGVAFLLISHDLDVVGHLAERVYVMRAGEVVEEGAAPSVLETPSHAYTQALMAAGRSISLR